MTIEELKKYIFENEKIENVLRELKCHNIKLDSRSEYWSASFPDGDNPKGVNIKNNRYLNFNSFSRGISSEEGKDIIDLVQYVTDKSFIDSVKYLHNILGLEYTPYKKDVKKQEDKHDPLCLFKRIRAKRKCVNKPDIRCINDDVLDDYIPLTYIDWYRDDGIMPWTRKKFGLAYSYRRKRVIIPVRHWLTGDLVGVNARTTIANSEELGIPKYILTHGYNKANNLYGYHENHEDIERIGHCVIYESEKSVLKRDSRNDPSGLALQGKSISDEQVRIVLSLNVGEIVICLDNDVSQEEIFHMCEKFWHFRKVSYIKDEWGLLKSKDSAADAPNKIYNFLFKYRKQYGNKEHGIYLKSIGAK